MCNATGCTPLRYPAGEAICKCHLFLNAGRCLGTRQRPHGLGHCDVHGLLHVPLLHTMPCDTTVLTVEAAELQQVVICQLCLLPGLQHGLRLR